MLYAVSMVNIIKAFIKFRGLRKILGYGGSGISGHALDGKEDLFCTV